MARRARIIVPGQVHHIFHHGHNGQEIFLHDDDYSTFYHVLREEAGRTGCEIHAYVLLPNHVHFLITPSHENSLAAMFQGIGRKFVRYINRTYDRSGTLWEGRFRSALVEAEHYFLHCCKYIELAPLRAGIVKRLDQFPWSSFWVNALAHPDDFITPHKVYLELGYDASSRAKYYTRLLESPPDKESMELIQRKIRQGGIIGSNEFQKWVCRKTNKRVSNLLHGGDRKSRFFLENVSEVNPSSLRDGYHKIKELLSIKNKNQPKS